MFGYAAHIADLRAQIEQLERLLVEERGEKRHLLDCLLQKNNASPLKETIAPQPTQPVVQFMHPFGGGATPEMVEAATQSAIDEETAYLMAEQNYPEEQARMMAEQRFLKEYRA